MRSVPWTSLGPDNVSGRVISHAFHPDSTGVLLVGAASGGLWRSADGGSTWSPLTDSLMSLAVSAVAYNPANPRSIVVGTGEGYGQSDAVHGAGVFRSNDGGATWTYAFLWDWRDQTKSVDSFDIVWDERDTSNVYLASSDGVYVNRNAAEGSFDSDSSNWMLILPGRTTALIAIASPDSLQTLLAAVVHGDTPPDSSLQPSAPVGLYRSIDRGLTWTADTAFVNTILATGDSLTSLGFTSLSANDSGTIYASISQTLAGGNGLFALLRSDDFGASWTRLEPQMDGEPANILCGDPTTPSQCQGRYDNVVAVSPADPDLVFVGGVDLYRSRDGGRTFELVTKNPPNTPDATDAVHADHHDFGFDPHRPGAVYAFNDGGVFASGQEGDPGSWEARNAGLTTLQIYAISGTEQDTNWIAAGAQDNGTLLRIGPGNDWIELDDFGGDGTAVLVDPENKSIIYGERQNGFLQRTLNAGSVGRCILQRCSSNPMNDGRVTNKGITGLGPWFTPLAIDPKNPRRLYTSTLVQMWVTQDGRAPDGVTWDPMGPAISSVQLIAVDQVDTTLLYAYSGPASRLVRSEDGGATWTDLAFPGKYVSDLQTDPDTRGIVYLVRSGPCLCDDERFMHQIMVSRDAGETWRALDETVTGLPVLAHTIEVLPATDVGYKRIVVGTDLGVLASTARGTDVDSTRYWFDPRGNLPYVIVKDLEYNASDNTIRAGTYGRGVWKANADAVFRFDEDGNPR